jgi:hypothetical protein
VPRQSTPVQRPDIPTCISAGVCSHTLTSGNNSSHQHECLTVTISNSDVIWDLSFPQLLPSLQVHDGYKVSAGKKKCASRITTPYRMSYRDFSSGVSSFGSVLSIPSFLRRFSMTGANVRTPPFPAGQRRLKRASSFWVASVHRDVQTQSSGNKTLRLKRSFI